MVTPRVYPRLVAGILTLLHRRIQHQHVVDLEGLKIQVCPHVFHPLHGRTTKFFIQKMRILPSSRVLEIGTGSGAIAAAAVRAGGQVIATDLNPYAVECAKITLELNGFQKRVAVLLGDLFAPVQGKTFDTILFNPPYFPYQASNWISSAWSAFIQI